MKKVAVLFKTILMGLLAPAVMLGGAVSAFAKGEIVVKEADVDVGSSSSGGVSVIPPGGSSSGGALSSGSISNESANNIDGKTLRSFSREVGKVYKIIDSKNSSSSAEADAVEVLLDAGGEGAAKTSNVDLAPISKGSPVYTSSGGDNLISGGAFKPSTGMKIINGEFTLE